MTTAQTVIDAFHSYPMSSYVLPLDLELQWLYLTVGEYENEIGDDLKYDADEHTFSTDLSASVVGILSLMMYVRYLTRETSRVAALNGFIGKDITITGGDATKRVTKAELDSERDNALRTLHKMKRNCFGGDS